MKSKREKYLKKQEINTKRGIYTRARRKKFWMLKTTKQLAQYYAQRAGYQIRNESKVKKLSLWQRFTRFMKRLFGSN